MPVVNINRFDLIIDQYHSKFDEEVHAPIYDFLDRSGLRRHLEGFLNKILTTMATKAAREAVVNRTMVISFTVNCAKASQRFFKKLPEDFQQSIEPNLIMMAMELLLEEEGFLIENHTLKYERTILPEEDPEEVFEGDAAADQSPPAPQIPETTPASPAPPVGRVVRAPTPPALTSAQSPAPAPTPAPPAPPAPEAAPEVDSEPELGGDDDSEEIDEAELDQDLAELEAQAPSEDNLEEGVEPGMVFGNGRGIHRKIEAIEDGDVQYTVLQGKGSVKAGSEGKSSYKAFLQWSKERITS